MHFSSASLYGYGTWSLTLREAPMQRLVENRATRKIFGPKGDKVKGEKRRLHIEEHHDLYFSLIFTRAKK